MSVQHYSNSLPSDITYSYAPLCLARLNESIKGFNLLDYQYIYTKRFTYQVDKCGQDDALTTSDKTYIMNPIHSKYSSVETLIFPDAITLKILLTGKQTSGKQAIFEDIVEPGIGPGRHIHYNQDETFFFLEGDFIAEVDGKMFQFKPGDVAFIPKGTVHAFKNVGKNIGRLRYIFSPADTIEEMFREMYSVLQIGDLTFEKMSEISKKHGQEFVGPPL